MINKTKPNRIFALFIIISLILPFISGCGAPRKTETEIQTEANTVTETDSATETFVETEKEEETAAEETEMKWDGPHVKELKVGGVDISEFKICSPQSGVNTYVKRACADLVSYIEKATGVSLEITDEECEHMICVGETEFDTQRVKEARETLVNNGTANRHALFCLQLS